MERRGREVEDAGNAGRPGVGKVLGLIGRQAVLFFRAVLHTKPRKIADPLTRTQS